MSKEEIVRTKINIQTIFKKFGYNPNIHRIGAPLHTNYRKKIFEKDGNFEESFKGIAPSSVFSHEMWKKLVEKGIIKDLGRETILDYIKKKNIDHFLLKLQEAVTRVLLQKKIRLPHDINLTVKITISITLLDDSFLTLSPRDFLNIYFIEKLRINVPRRRVERRRRRQGVNCVDNTSKSVSNIDNIIALVGFDTTNNTITEPFDKNTFSFNWDFANLKDKIQYITSLTEDQIKLLSNDERGLIQVLCNLILTELRLLMESPPKIMDETVQNVINTIIIDCETIIYPTSDFQKDAETEYIISSDINDIITVNDDIGETIEIAEVTPSLIKNINIGSTTINSENTYYNNVTILENISTKKIDVNSSAYIKGNTRIGGEQEVQGNIIVCGSGKNTFCGDTTCTNKFRCEDSISCSEFQNSSDRRLKENISHIQNASNNIKLLNPVQYSFINDENKRIKMGIIAQEIKEIFPDIVNNNGDHLTVEYNSLIGLLIKGFQEQQEEILELRRKIEFIEK